MMHWVELAFEISPTTAELSSEQLFSLGAHAVTFYDQRNNPILEPNPDETPLWEHVRCVGLFENNEKLPLIKAMLSKQLATSIEEHILPDRNWIEAFQDQLKPMHFGHNFWVCPQGQSAPSQDAISITLEPGLAFGTGTHPTTTLCLEWLAKHPPTAHTVIDYGCGSGILSLAALALGAEAVLAIDHCPQAITSTNNNAALNNIHKNALRAYLPENAPEGQVNLLIANILKNPLIELASLFAKHTKMGGTLLLTGILEEQTNTLFKAYHPWFTFMPPIKKEEWVLLVGTRCTESQIGSNTKETFQASHT